MSKAYKEPWPGAGLKEHYWHDQLRMLERARPHSRAYYRAVDEQAKWRARMTENVAYAETHSTEAPAPAL